MGVNVLPVASALSPELVDRSASLGELVTPAPTVDEVEELVVRAANAAVASLGSAAGVRATRDRCQARLYGVGRRATVDGIPAGTIAALGADGELLLETGTHRVAIRAGDLRVEGAT